MEIGTLCPLSTYFHLLHNILSIFYMLEEHSAPLPHSLKDNYSTSTILLCCETHIVLAVIPKINAVPRAQNATLNQQNSINSPNFLHLFNFSYCVKSNRSHSIQLLSLDENIIPLLR